MVTCEDEEARVLKERYGRISRGQEGRGGAQGRDEEICLTLKSKAKGGGSGSKFK